MDFWGGFFTDKALSIVTLIVVESVVFRNEMSTSHRTWHRRSHLLKIGPLRLGYGAAKPFPWDGSLLSRHSSSQNGFTSLRLLICYFLELLILSPGSIENRSHVTCITRFCWLLWKHWVNVLMHRGSHFIEYLTWFPIGLIKLVSSSAIDCPSTAIQRHHVIWSRRGQNIWFI